MILPLINSVERYRADSEEEAYTFIEEMKKQGNSGNFIASLI